MGQGQGSITVNQKAPIIPPPGPPFALNSADNGLSVDPLTFHLVFGQSIGAVGDPAQLLNNREIPLNGFELFMRQGANPLFELNGSGVGLFLAGIGDLNGTFGNNGQLAITNGQSANLFSSGTNFMGLTLQSVPAVAQLGDLGGGFNGDFMQIDANAGVTQLGKPNNDPALILDTIQRQYSIGDLLPLGNGLQLFIDDNSGFLQLGDATGAGLGTQLKITTPTGPRVLVSDSANEYLDLDITNDVYAMGNNLTLQNQLTVSSFNSKIFGILGGNRVMELDGGNNTFKIGDIDGVINTTVLNVDNTNSEFNMSNAALNSKVRMNGVLGFTGTVAPPLTITVNGGIVTNVA